MFAHAADTKPSVDFYGDLILSKAGYEYKIVLWRIEGFDSTDPPPPPSTAPTVHDPSRTTRSAFAPTSAPSQWMRLLEFDTLPERQPQFYLRFSLHHVYGQHPILCFCNSVNQIMMWDMMRLTAYQDFVNALCDPDRDPTARVAKPPWLLPAHHKLKAAPPPLDAEGEEAWAASIMRPIRYKDPFDIEKILLAEGYNQQTIAQWQSRFDMSNPNKRIKPHKVEHLQGNQFVGRQSAWSPNGCWCVVVGSRNHAAIFQRWAKNERSSSSRQNSNVPSDVLSYRGTPAMGGESDVMSVSASFAQTDEYM